MLPCVQQIASVRLKQVLSAENLGPGLGRESESFANRGSRHQSTEGNPGQTLHCFVRFSRSPKGSRHRARAGEDQSRDASSSVLWEAVHLSWLFSLPWNSLLLFAILVFLSPSLFPSLLSICSTGRP